MSEDIIDLKEVMERVQDDQELFFELLDIFQEDYEEKRKLFDGLVAQKDFDQLRNVAHSLKGASSNISAKKIYALFSQLEKAAEHKEGGQLAAILANIDQQYAALQSTIKKLKEEFKKF